MKKRMIKKMAKRYLASNGTYTPFGTYCEDHRIYNDGTPAVVKIFAVFPGKVAREICQQASRQGWDGNHWDHPLLIEVTDEKA